MTVSELLEILEEAEGELGGETEVRIAFQPSWPLQYKTGTAVTVDPSEAPPTDGPCDPCEWGEDAVCPDCGAEQFEEEEKAADHARLGGEPVVYIEAGYQVADSPYLPGSVSRALGWR